MKKSSTFVAQSKLLTKQLTTRYERHFVNPENFFAYNYTSLELDDESLIVLNGKLVLNTGLCMEAQRSTFLRLDRNAKLTVTNGTFRVLSGGDIVVFPNGELTLGNSYITRDCKIHCANKITIGDDCAISHNVTILDSDFHILVRKGEERPRHGTGTEIGNHVWIGTGAIILKNVHIGDGAVVAAGSVVTRDVPARVLVAGNPAIVMEENIDWKK